MCTLLRQNGHNAVLLPDPTELSRSCPRNRILCVKCGWHGFLRLTSHPLSADVTFHKSVVVTQCSGLLVDRPIALMPHGVIRQTTAIESQSSATLSAWRQALADVCRDTADFRYGTTRFTTDAVPITHRLRGKQPRKRQPSRRLAGMLNGCTSHQIANNAAAILNKLKLSLADVVVPAGAATDDVSRCETGPRLQTELAGLDDPFAADDAADACSLPSLPSLPTTPRPKRSKCSAAPDDVTSCR
jgi:hypothetical protein